MITDAASPGSVPPELQLPGSRYRAAVVLGALGLALVIVGAVLAYTGYRSTGGPAGAVRGYFAALHAADAPRALAWGAVPSGPRGLLTSAVLAEQQHLAPIQNLTIGQVTRRGARASVPVGYGLGFASGVVRVRSRIAVVQRRGDWRLASVAVPTLVRVTAARQRITLAGGRLPADPVLLFPGAVPVRFDTPYLQLAGSTAHVELGGAASASIGVSVSAAGRAAATAAVRSALAHCFAAGFAPVSCPLPDARYVPGTLDGSAIPGPLTVTATSSPAGVLAVSGTARFTGAYRRLTFANQQRAGRGTLTLHVRAATWAIAPLRPRWSR